LAAFNMAYRILSLDGGGSWALIQVRALIALYSETKRGNEVLADFDPVAANSGGSIVLGGLIENLQLGDILQYFLDAEKRSAMFSPTDSVVDTVLSSTLGIGPKYATEPKLLALAAC
jgi:patatin-like phospholipase/acyl hydrolase